MKVSVSIVTFNHEKFIAQAIDSVLMQKTDFDYEIIIGEDESEDNTRTIVKDYKSRYQDKIRLFLNNRKKLIYINGRPTGRLNLINNLRHAQGEYVALLEGDDYWTDPYKLQKQVDFLDSNPDFSICFHNAYRLNELDECQLMLGSYLCTENQKTVSNLEDIMTNNFIPTLTVMYRNKLFDDFPEWYLHVPFGDWPLHILNAQFGKIGYLNETMAVYRMHPGGATASIFGNKEKYIKHISEIIQTYEILKPYLGPKYLNLIRHRISDWYRIQAETYGENGNIISALRLYSKSALINPNRMNMIKVPKTILSLLINQLRKTDA